MEQKSRIVNSIQSYFISHFPNLNSGELFQIFIPDGHQKCIDSLIFALDYGLGKDKSHIGMDSTIGNPILLGESGGAVDNKLLCLFVIGGSSLHFHCVIAISELSQAEASGNLESV